MPNHAADPPAYDVLVCGGGTAGLPAAVAAARMGARVAIIERYGFLGGNAAASIMPCWHGLSGHHSGLLTTFARRVEEFGVGPIPLQDNHIEPEVVKQLFLELALEHGVDLHLHRLLTGAVVDGTRVVAAVTESKSGRRELSARAFVDASGDGDLSHHAGAQSRKGVEGATQAMSLRFCVGYVDFARFAEWSAGKPELRFSGDPEAVARRDAEGNGRLGIYFGSRLDLLYEEHRDECPDLPANTYFNCSSIRPHELSINTTRVYGLDGTSADDLTRAEIVTRRQAWAVWRFLRDHVPGFERSVITETATQVGVRETRCIVGDHVLTVEEGEANRWCADSVQTCRVHFDSHDRHRYDTGGNRGLVDVPYGCFLPRGLEAVLLAGRCVSCDHLMNSGFRRMENCFESGEVAGTAAALAVLRGLTPRQLPVGELQSALRDRGFATSQTDGQNPM